MTSFKGMSDCPIWWGQLEQLQGDRIFDVGANGGTTAARFSYNFKQVVALEPAAESFADLQVVAARHPEIVPLQVAASHYDGSIRLREAEYSLRTGELVTGESLGNWGPTVGWRDVPCVTLDTLMSEYGLPSTVKVDVEGHEVMVLRGAKNLISLGCHWMIEVHNGEFEPLIRELLDGYDIEIFRHSGYRERSMEWLQHFYLEAVAN